MFDLPLPVPSRTTYRDLGVSPDASDDEVRSAKAEAVRRLEAQRNALLKDVNRVRDEVSGLKTAVDDVATLRAAGAEADQAALTRALAKLGDLERAATARDPTYRQQCDRMDALARRIDALNQKALDKPDARLAHDRAHPPLALLRLSACTRDAFVEPRTALFLVRRDVAAWLEAHGSTAYHPSDLTRADFSADFQPNPLLDKEHHHG